MFDRYKVEVLKYLRKDLSYNAMSRKIGYSYNQYFKFESGNKRFMLQDFIHTCEVVNFAPLKEAFSQSLGIELVEKDTKSIIRNVCKKWGSPSKFMVEEYMAISWSKWWRIYNGKVDISFVEFLKLIDILSVRLLDFLEYFLDSEQKQKLLATNNPALDFLKKYPEATLILTGIHLKAYLDSSAENKLETLSHLIKIPLSRLDILITKMVENKILYYEDGILKDHIYKIDAREEEKELRNTLMNFVLNKTIEANEETRRITDESKRIFGTCKVMPVSVDAREKIIYEMRNYQRKVLEIVDGVDHSNKDTLILLNNNIVDV